MSAANAKASSSSSSSEDEEDTEMDEPQLIPFFRKPTALSPDLNRAVFAYQLDPTGSRCVSAPLLDLIRSKKWYSHDGDPLQSLCYARVLAPEDPDRPIVQRRLFHEEPWPTQQEDRAVGVLLGMAIGDSVGAKLEFQHVRYGIVTVTGPGDQREGSFGLKPGQWTDDNSMGLCVTDSLLSTKGVLDPHDLMLRFQAWWNGGYNNGFCYDDDNRSKHSVGLGGNISMSMYSYFRDGLGFTKAGDKQTSGNGSIMRNGSPPVCHHDNIEIAMQTARAQSLVTHQGEEAAECCRLMAHIAVKAINGETKESIMTNLRNTFTSPIPSVVSLSRSEMEGENLDRDWRWMAESYRYSPTRSRQQPGYIGSYAMDGLCMALHCIWTTNSFTDAIIKSANMCGDADSVTSVTGQLAGALYGASDINVDWIRAVQQWDGNGDISLRAYRLFHHKWL